jgi:putative Mg2+ transporter-C (MgtC) family protein
MITENQAMLRLLVSSILGGLIGFERQIHRRDAGMRTHMLVALGSCLIMLTSLYVFDIYRNIASVDPARIASGVITGIGFLGAGAIIRDASGVKGLTTAASLWLVAAIGMAVGIGVLRISMYATILGLIILFFLRYIEGVFAVKNNNETS